VVVFGDQAAQFGQPIGHHIEDAIIAVVGNFLRQVGDAGRRSHPETAVIRHDLAAKDAHQGRLALAVASHQADALPPVQFQVHLLQQGAVSEGERDLVKAQQGHGYSGTVEVARVLARAR
jgi:hypothetical protein